MKPNLRYLDLSGQHGGLEPFRLGKANRLNIIISIIKVQFRGKNNKIMAKRHYNIIRMCHVYIYAAADHEISSACFVERCKHGNNSNGM